MIKYVSLFILLTTFACERRKDQANNIDTTTIDTTVHKIEPRCKMSDLEVQALVSDCKACHTLSGHKEPFPIISYPELHNLGPKILRQKIDSLKVSHQNHLYIDTMSNETVDCIIDYIGRYSKVQP